MQTACGYRGPRGQRHIQRLQQRSAQRRAHRADGSLVREDVCCLQVCDLSLRDAWLLATHGLHACAPVRLPFQHTPQLQHTQVVGGTLES